MAVARKSGKSINRSPTPLSNLAPLFDRPVSLRGYPEIPQNSGFNNRDCEEMLDSQFQREMVMSFGVSRNLQLSVWHPHDILLLLIIHAGHLKPYCKGAHSLHRRCYSVHVWQRGACGTFFQPSEALDLQVKPIFEGVQTADDGKHVVVHPPLYAILQRLSYGNPTSFSRHSSSQCFNFLGK